MLFFTEASLDTNASTFVLNEPADFLLSGGASVQAAPLNSLRSGNPGSRATAAVRASLNANATIERVTLAYRYDTGFASGTGTNFTLQVSGQSVYASPHLTDYQYDHNRSNYSLPVQVDASGLGITVPAGGSHIEFVFDNNDRNVQLLLPLQLSLECSGPVPCTPPPPPPPKYRLTFGVPSIASGPEYRVQGGGPFWSGIHRLSDTHALGWQEGQVLGTTDGGLTWSNMTAYFGASCPQCDFSTKHSVYPAGVAGLKTLGPLNQSFGGSGNLTGLASASSTRYFIGPDDSFARELVGPVTVTGLPNLRMYAAGSSGEYITLPDGSMVGISKSTLGSGSGRLSAVAIRSTDGGFNWTFASVVASAEEVPYASEGPSEGTLATLRNGTLMAVMRVDGQSGHYAPYISKLSDDGGLTWHSLRPLHGGGSGGVDGAGCVRPRLLALGTSLVLSGGRPNPLSRDVLVWLNSEGDGEEWFPYSISYWHNLRNTNSNWTWPSDLTNNSRAFPRLSTSYTSLIRTGNKTGYVLYGMGNRAFTLPFQLEG